MPTLRFHGVSAALVQRVATQLSPVLAAIVKVEPDWFMYESVGSTFISHEGQPIVRPPVYVDLLWFSRGQEIQDKVAAAVSKAVREELAKEGGREGGEEGLPDVTLIATQIERHDYYENGTHF